MILGLLLILVPGIAVQAGVPKPGENIPEEPLSDSVFEKQRDSILTELNLQFLNAVNERRSPFEVIPIIEEILVLDPDQHNHWFNLGIENIKIHEYHRAIDALNKGIELYPDEDNSTLCQIYISLSFCYNKIEKHQKEKEILDHANNLFPDNPGIIGRQIICAHSRLLFHEAEENLHQLTMILREQGLNEAEIAFHLGRLYLNTDYIVAEKYFRVAYHYDPEDVKKQGALAWVLIQNALRINEGMSLMEDALELDPDNAIFIHQLGYGYFVKGEYETALDKLYTARDLYAEFSFELNHDIEMVQDALAKLEQ
jgi:tetratricopeptide (TPR) repeat protein